MAETGTTGGRRGGVILALVATAAAIAGILVLVFALASQEPAPPELGEARGELEESESPAPSAEETPAPVPDVEPAKEKPLAPSPPVSISIPAIDVDSEVFGLGTADDGTLAVPQPGPNLDKAAWFENSPTPGQPGPSIIEGHVATEENGPSVFFDLAELRPGDRIEVEREDGRTAVFEVDALREFGKDEFPTELVYGGNLSDPQLRLITCSGFDPDVGTHTSNLVVFSHLESVRGR